VSNIVMMGFTAAITKIINERAMGEAVKVSVPKGTEKLNNLAFVKGLEYGRKLIEEKDVPL